MRALHSFSVRPSLPPELAALGKLAMNLRWSWDARTRDLFRWVDPERWETVAHDPVQLLGAVPPPRLAELASEAAFTRYLAEVAADLDRYVTQPRWFQDRQADIGSPLRLVAYFSPEFGISEALPQYSGGLGVLAGDHLKAASDLGLPLVGVGLFYRHGYFRQSLGLDGIQHERFPTLDPDGLALTRCDGVRVELDLGGESVACQLWRADVGRVSLYLLDTDVDGNSPAAREITDRLYGGDTEHRLRQEIVLGVGGVRALQAVGLEPQVFHTNEGHAGFLGLERARQLVAGGLNFAEAIEAVRAGNVFTTHTPVPAGIDRFPAELMQKYFGAFGTACGVPFEDVMALGLRDDEPEETKFNMAVMGLRLAARRNGVARLHGEVSRAMFAGLWPDTPVDDVPIGSVTNGVHAPTWLSPEMHLLLDREVGPTWDGGSAEQWRRVLAISDDELWRARQQGRDRLVRFVRERLRAARLALGRSPSELSWCDNVLDPGGLIICFARRFATYKRATLLLSQAERLTALLLDPERPVQFVFAGKAHPADGPGKALIQQVQQFANQPEVRTRFVFLEDYDIAVARALYHGADVWLNTPRRPLEACGTSGMKAALNGALNCSVLDGWWDEWFDGTNGWAITSAPESEDLAQRDALEAANLFELLEAEIVPLFYERAAGGVPRAWLGRVKSAFASLGPKVTARRMVRDYVADYYEPAAASADHILADSAKAAKELAAWRARVLAGWNGVAVVGVDTDTSSAELGALRPVTVRIALNGLHPDDVVVQVLHGAVGPADELIAPGAVALTHAADENGAGVFLGSFPCDTAGRHGFTVRVLPAHPDLASPVELGRTVWA
jgi:starch phosphorylase